MSNQEKIDSILDKVEKLLRLAAVNSNEAEAASATAKAQDLLAAHNLSMDAVTEKSSSGSRLKEEFEGGRFEWQKELWSAVASMNFCVHVNRQVFVESALGTQVEIRRNDEDMRVTVRGMWQSRHQVVGRKLNVKATFAMATYLESVCDRLVKDRVKATNERANGRWANSYRQGIVDRIIGKLYDRRAELLDEDRRKQFEARTRAAEAMANSGISLSNALTLSSFTEQEEDANIDFMFGEGTAAQWAADRAREAAAERAADEEYTRWAAANPEKARKQEAERKEKEERARQRASKQHLKGKDSRAWLEGYRKGDEVSLDQQAEHRKAAGMLK
jgi:hypothetical protein